MVLRVGAAGAGAGLTDTSSLALLLEKVASEPQLGSPFTGWKIPDSLLCSPSLQDKMKRNLLSGMFSLYLQNK